MKNLAKYQKKDFKKWQFCLVYLDIQIKSGDFANEILNQEPYFSQT